MHIETGLFGPFKVSWSIHSTASFEAVICFAHSEEPRLQDGVYELFDELTPYVSWLHDEMGLWGQSWYIDHQMKDRPGWTHVYLPTEADAAYFLFRWAGEY